MTSSGYRHGGTGTPLYEVWAHMLGRCRNPNNRDYSYYGGRGIRVCDRWLAFAAFAQDMGPRPERMTLERINVNGNYEPSNCRWATQLEQANNKRSNKYLTFQGRTQNLAAWERETGLSYRCIKKRLAAGWSVRETLTWPAGRGRGPRHSRLIAFQGRTMPMVEWAREIGLHRRTLQARLNSGWPIAEALTLPLGSKKPPTHD